MLNDLHFRFNWFAYILRKDALWYLNYAEIVGYLMNKLFSISLQAISIAHFRYMYIKMLTWLRGLTDKIALSPLSRIPRGDEHLKPKPNIEISPESLEVMLEFWYIEHGLLLGYSGYHLHAPSKGLFSVCWNLSFRGRQSTVSMVFSRYLTEKIPFSLNEGRRLTRIILNDDFELRACIEKAYVVATYSV